VCCGFLSPLKSIALAGFEPANFGSSGKHTNHYTTKATLRVGGGYKWYKSVYNVRSVVCYFLTIISVYTGYIVSNVRVIMYGKT
jgi:hypothetical protein